jgi:hypothetical protein
VVLARVFVSHSSADNDVAHTVGQFLTGAGHEVFLDVSRERGIHIGEEWKQRLLQQLRGADAVVCLVSDASVTSDWCTFEIISAQVLGARLLPVSVQGGVVHPQLSDVQHEDYVADPDAALRAIDAALSADMVGVGWVDGANPYPGLRAFDAGWQRVFFGRDRDIGDLAARVRAAGNGVVAVVGPSGCGKSSLVRAGLMPALAGEPGWVVVPAVLPGARPVDTVGVELAAAGVRLGLGWSVAQVAARLDERSGLADLAQDLLVAASMRSRRQRLLLVLDQFEEVLTQADPVQQTRLGQVLTATGPVTVVLTLRPEFLTPLLRHADLAFLGRDTFTVGPVDADQLRAVIVGPARMAGLTVSAGLLDRLVTDTATTDGLPLLAFTLQQLADGVPHGGELSEQRYD